MRLFFGNIGHFMIQQQQQEEQEEEEEVKFNQQKRDF